jgi:hypothetical protein
MEIERLVSEHVRRNRRSIAVRDHSIESLQKNIAKGSDMDWRRPGATRNFFTEPNRRRRPSVLAYDCDHNFS